MKVASATDGFDRRRGSSAVPRWLFVSLFAAAALVAGLLVWEVFFARPGYGVGDETAQIQKLVDLSRGGAFQWLWAQGSLQRVGLWLWLALVGHGLGRLHIPGIAILALEAGLLWRVTLRWFSREAAVWAVLVDLLCAATWMRSRSILSYHWLPLELLVLACVASKVRGPLGALLWGAAGGFLLLDYEGAMAALPGLFVACFFQEEALRRRWPAVCAGCLGVAMFLMGIQPRVLGDYVHLRMAVNWGGGLGAALPALGHNLSQLLVGGRPMPYLGVDAWPSVAAWSLPFLGLGVWVAWSGPGRGILVWALSALLITQAALAPWGLPSHRLVAAWPALCMLSGAGAVELRRRWSALPSPVWIVFLCLGCAGEANAFYRHMAFHGRQVYGRAALLQAASHDARRAAAQGVMVSTALLETRSNDVRFFIDPSPGFGSSAGAWVFLPTEFRVPALSAGRCMLYRSSLNDLPVLVLLAPAGGPVRFRGIERDLRPLLDSDSTADETAWLSRPLSHGDDWAYAAVLDRHLRRLWRGLPVDRALTEMLVLRPALTPGPLSLMGRYLVQRDPHASVAMLNLALRVDPLWDPALEDRVSALESDGQAAAAKLAAEELDGGLRQRDWRDYD